MDSAAVLEAFNRQVRQSTEPDGTGARLEVDDRFVRRVPAAGEDGGAVVWSRLDAGCADEVIAAQVAFFAGRGQKEFEWKLYSYDQPTDLADRLAAAGLVPEEPEALMVAEIAELPGDAAPPAGIRLEQVTDAEGIGRALAMSEEIFGRDGSQYRSALLEQLGDAGETMVLILAIAGDQPVSAGRIEFVRGTEFAGLWGGGTLPGWRGRGVYRALVHCRARLAAARGYRYLQVDASPESRPILARMGFAQLAETTPYLWSPRAG